MDGQPHRAGLRADGAVLARVGLTLQIERAQFADDAGRRTQRACVAAPGALDEQRCHQHDHEHDQSCTHAELEQAPQRSPGVDVAEDHESVSRRAAHRPDQHRVLEEAQVPVEHGQLRAALFEGLHRATHTGHALLHEGREPAHHLLDEPEGTEPPAERVAGNQRHRQGGHQHDQVGQVHVRYVLAPAGDVLVERLQSAHGAVGFPGSRDRRAAFSDQSVPDRNGCDEQKHAQLGQAAECVVGQQCRQALAPRLDLPKAGCMDCRCHVRSSHKGDAPARNGQHGV